MKIQILVIDIKLILTMFIILNNKYVPVGIVELQTIVYLN